MTEHHDAQDADSEEPLPAGYPGWRRVHVLASWMVAGVGAAHCVVTAFAFRTWSPDTVWFLGAGLGVLLVGLLNLVHIGVGPCHMPTVRFVRLANLVFAVFSVAALLAVPEPQTVVLVVALAAQVWAGRVTMPGPV
jgi:hypothetical protein